MVLLYSVKRLSTSVPASTSTKQNLNSAMSTWPPRPCRIFASKSSIFESAFSFFPTWKWARVPGGIS